MITDEQIERALVVTAHPDDVDFGAAGTIAALTERGVEVAYCIVTDGDAGGFDPEYPRSGVAPLRRSEQEAAAKVVGVDDVRFLGYPDGRVTVTLELRRDIARVIRIVRPQLVITQHPERNFKRIYASHPDHMAVGEATLCAVYPDARNPFAYPELDEPAWSVPLVWVMGGPQPDRWVDITDTFERKIQALLCHTSQMSHPEGMPDRMVQWGQAIARQGGLPEGRLAEAYTVVDTQ